ncbi:nuclear transport factor 2 family protein [Gelidibacter maritimus]|uniref:Nuclear transport factor 2 family protein n=1 Tax=Gelidibacter maritimus TaxID=2761487 RepID=A0A7W2M360_9FLAO|nr:nuclear transport factor 2 family protein [Gelidibacter maritimus]MBA6151849.1 nuclear transport factor 2 family protein [Gelidibacter maritimus]
MRLIIITLCILTIGCSSKQTSSYEQLDVIATVYESIPKAIPPPNSEDEEENDIDYLNLEPLNFNYVINENFVDFDFDYIYDIPNRFQVYKSKDLFEEKVLDFSYMKLIAGLSEFEKNEKINTSKLEALLGENLVFWDKEMITIEEKNEHDISGVISFSKVSFNEDLTRAAVVVGDYFERIGNGISLYILEKIDGKWVIKYTQALITS